MIYYTLKVIMLKKVIIILFSILTLLMIVYFILKGSIKLQTDISEVLSDDALVDPDFFNVPFNLYVEGSYFGDSDCLLSKKAFRECMALAEQECHLLVLKKHILEDLLKDFDDIRHQMMDIAAEKKKYHERLVQEIEKKHKYTLKTTASTKRPNTKKKE
jgi:CRP-like cAMP-binding protein